jgi:hypothetical protein
VRKITILKALALVIIGLGILLIMISDGWLLGLSYILFIFGLITFIVDLLLNYFITNKDLNRKIQVGYLIVVFLYFYLYSKGYI